MAFGWFKRRNAVSHSADQDGAVMGIYEKHAAILGFKVKDKVTGFEGVAASVCFDLYGCVQIAVTPAAKDGKLEDGRYFDIQRLTVESSERVMPIPSFAALATAEGVHKKGPAEKPAFR